MAKNRIRSSYCHNCGKVLQEKDNFCPNCGQENDNKRQSFRKVMYEHFEGLISIDSRLAHSIPALIFRPGFLTKEFLKGRRQRYLEPVKMFLSIVVLYFILASFEESVNSKNEATFAEKINSAQQSGDTLVVMEEGLLKLKFKTAENKDTIIQASDNFELDDPHYNRIQELVKEGITDTRQVLDSINVESTFWNRFYYSEVIKFASTDYEEFKEYIISKLPWILFLLMPVFAMLLKLVYKRRDFLYIDHVIFAFHLHSFLFLTGIVFVLAELIFQIDISGWLITAVLIYLLLAFKNFYRQSWIKTFLKIFLLWGLYIITAFFGMLFSLVIMFLIY